jgi:serine/threonine-protein kinase
MAEDVDPQASDSNEVIGPYRRTRLRREDPPMPVRSDAWEGLAIAGGRYVIAAKLGEGGMGSVYFAWDRISGRNVVIKVPRRAMLEDPEFAGRFAREIRSLVRLSHPRVVEITDYGEWSGLPFAVTQFLPGGSLEHRQATGADGRSVLADPADVPGWLTGIADALDYVHSQGYVHRDVRPGNILFDAQGHSFLSDFGVAKVLASSNEGPSSRTAMTGAGMVLGTPEYMAPELIMGEAFDGRVDQYALAITVYELLCGRRPFEDEAKTKVLVLHTTKPPPPPSELRSTLSTPLSEVILKGMAKDPKSRFRTCTAFAEAVAAAVGGNRVSDDRGRVRCTSCGHSLSMRAPDFARLKQSGRKAPCPACKAPSVFSIGAEGLGVSGETSPRTPAGRQRCLRALMLAATVGAVLALGAGWANPDVQTFLYLVLPPSILLIISYAIYCIRSRLQNMYPKPDGADPRPTPPVDEVQFTVYRPKVI